MASGVASLLYKVRWAATTGGAYPPLAVSYPFMAMEGSSVSTQAAELTKRFSGGRAEFFPATFLETIVTTKLGRDSSAEIKRTDPARSLVDRVKTPCVCTRLQHSHLFLWHVIFCVRSFSTSGGDTGADTYHGDRRVSRSTSASEQSCVFDCGRSQMKCRLKN